MPALRRIVERPAPKPSLMNRRRVRDSFWRLPAKTQADPGQLAALTQQPGRSVPKKPCSRRRARNSQTIPLGDGLVLSLTTRRGIDAEDLRSIRLAAASLIEVLRLRGLIDTERTRTPIPKPGDAR